MPQLAQLPLVFLSQWFWLSITLAAIYFFVGHGIVPRVEATVDARDRQIAADFAAAEQARIEAAATENAYRTRMDASRAEAGKLTLQAKTTGAKASEQTLATASAAIETRLSEASEKIKLRRAQALIEIQDAAADLTQEIVAKVAGVSVDRQAVEAALAEVRADA